MLSERLDEIELRIFEDKKELNKIINEIRESGEAGADGKDPILNNKLRNIQDNLFYLQAQLDYAREEAIRRNAETSRPHVHKNVEEQPVPTVATPMNKPMTESVEAVPSQIHPMTPVNSGAPGFQNPNYIPPQVQEQEQKPAPLGQINENTSWAKEKNQINTVQKAEVTAEELFGKKIMAIAASGLIFISLVLFAIVFIPSLDKAAKIFMMFAVSAAFLIFGVVKIEKSGKNSLYEALAGCGMGAVFVSLFLCDAYFKVLNDFVLYVLLLIWAGAALYMSKRYASGMFSAIGQIGIAVSVAFGMKLCTSVPYSADIRLRFIVLVIYFLIGNFAYYFFSVKNMRSRMINNVFHIISLIILVTGCSKLSYNSDIMLVIGVILLAADVIAMLVIAFRGWKEENDLNEKFISGIAYSLILFGIITVFIRVMAVDLYTLRYESMKGILYAISALVILVALEISTRKITLDKEKIPYNVWVGMLMLYFSLSVQKIDGIDRFVGVGIAALLATCYGYIADKYIYRISGYIAFVAYVILYSGDYIAFGVFLSFTILFGAFYIMYTMKNYTMLKKIVLLVLLLFNVFIKYCMIIEKLVYDDVIIDDATIFIILYAIYVVIGLVARFTPFRKNWLTKEEEKPFMLVLDIGNAVLLLFGMMLISMDMETGKWFITLILLIAVASLNLKRFLMDKENVVMHIYSAVKFTILMFVILKSMEAGAAVISIGCFIVAIACIVTGFMMKLEKLRVYGLVLSMICIVKLVMFDIVYSNTLGHAVSFFISGILCFSISAIYNYVGKRMNNEG